MQKNLENRVLVAIMNNKKDFLIAQEKGWYRIPVKSAPKNIRDETVVKYLAFYQTKIFGAEKYTIKWYAEIKNINKVFREELFKNESPSNKSNKEYYKIDFEELRQLKQPIVSKKGRRILFIPTTEQKFFSAKEINYLFNESPIEDKFWEALVDHNIEAERQYFINAQGKNRFLDFAIFCKDRNINVECDGDQYHTKINDVKYDKVRNNEISSLGWNILRFTTYQIESELEQSISLVKDTINRSGGIIQTTNSKKSTYFPKDDGGLFS
ncbi:DUF559 domain-containing protein [Bernardetia sp. Wsw4-3y2]|uniref:endonuclease domain-containing protein n=1 Tax=Bernardetia sp. Wsw4-3y2 TaxID=3127471 RepID=UPI0030D18FED